MGRVWDETLMLVRVVMLGIMCLFAGEVALVTFLFELPSISWCNTCDARPQQYYAGPKRHRAVAAQREPFAVFLAVAQHSPLGGVALGAGFVYAVSLYGHRRSQLQALQRSETIELCESVSQCEPVRRPSGRRGRCWRQPPWALLRS